MPIALLVAGRGDARDAVGLFLAGRGWTTLPADPDPGSAVQALRAAAPGLVAIDMRAGQDEALDCARALRAATTAPVLVLNVPAALEPAVAAIPGVSVAARAEDVPAAPGVPLPPHMAAGTG